MRFFFSFFFSEQQTCLIWVGHNFFQYEISRGNKELDLRMNKIQDKIQLKKSVVQSGLLCLSCLLMFILTGKFITNWKKIKQARKNWKPEFCWIKRAHEEQKRGSFETYTLFFFLA